jgi:hypothetical protein
MGAEGIVIGTQRPDMHIVNVLDRFKSTDVFCYGLGVGVFG